MKIIAIGLGCFVVFACAPSTGGQERARQTNSQRGEAPARQDQRQRNRSDPLGSLFAFAGVTFDAAQQKQVAQLRERFIPLLEGLNRRWRGVLSEEQSEARRNAIRTARDAGKNPREAQAAGTAAVTLSDDQQQQQQKLLAERTKLLESLRGEMLSLLNAEQRRAVRSNRRAGGGRRTPPTHANVKYGPHGRNVMDVWLAESKLPTPVLVSIHGGGFRGGNKGVDGNLLAACLKSGISVVAITYRLSAEAIAPAQFYDSARAIQTIRHRAKEWNLDAKRMAATGGSAGAGLSLWLGFHDDLADPDSEDPVLRQSTRLSCMSVYNGQTSYDPRFIRKLFPNSNTYQHSALAQLYDVDLRRLDDLPPDKYALMELVSSINHLTKGDPPAQLTYASTLETPITSQGIGIHHPRFAVALEKKAKPLAVEIETETGVRRGSEAWVRMTMEFVKQHLAVQEK